MAVDGRSGRESFGGAAYLKAICCFQFSTKLAAVLLVFVVPCVDLCPVPESV